MDIGELKKTLRSWINEGFTEGELSVDPGWYVLWQPEKIDELNQGYQLSEYAPGFIGFGSNGAGELLVVDEAGEGSNVPAIGMSPKEAIRIAGDLQEFKGYMQ